MTRNGLLLAFLLVVAACGQRDEHFVGPVFSEAGRPVERVCGHNVCVSQTFKNIGNATGDGACQMVKLASAKSHKETNGPLVALPSTEPGALTTARGSWPADEVEPRNVFWFRCEPAPVYLS